MQILLGADGRPSMLGVFGKMTHSESKLIVRRRIGSREWFRVYKNNDPSVRTKVKPANLSFDKVILRWGSRQEIDGEDHVIYNKGTAMALATDKKVSRQKLLEAGISCPKLVGANNTVFPVIARPSRHAKGRNFVVLKTKKAFLDHYNANETYGWYYSEFIDKSHEYRVHVAHGKVLEVMQKPKGEGIAWNRAVTGEAFVRVPRENYNNIPHMKAVCLEALKAAKVIGLDFSGVDVIVFNDVAYVLELNTSPTLNSSPHVTERYAKYFDWLARSDTKRPHWKFEHFKKAKSYIWKNFQLESNNNPTVETENE